MSCHSKTECEECIHASCLYLRLINKTWLCLNDTRKAFSYVLSIITEIQDCEKSNTVTNAANEWKVVVGCLSFLVFVLAVFGWIFIRWSRLRQQYEPDHCLLANTSNINQQTRHQEERLEVTHERAREALQSCGELEELRTEESFLLPQVVRLPKTVSKTSETRF